MLYIVPTPIGNLKDITLRALDVLRDVDLILAEDTRTTSHLLNHYEVTKPISPYHQHNEHKVLQHLVDQLMAGKKNRTGNRRRYARNFRSCISSYPGMYQE